MFAIMLSQFDDVRRAREYAGALAEAAGVPDPEMVALAVGEIGNNCIEHRDGEQAAVLRIGCRRGRLILRAENACQLRPSWQTAKPELIDGFHEGGYGFLLVQTLAEQVHRFWRKGRVVVRAEFA